MPYVNIPETYTNNSKLVSNKPFNNKLDDLDLDNTPI